jgi:hypothetical protein
MATRTKRNKRARAKSAARTERTAPRRRSFEEERIDALVKVFRKYAISLSRERAAALVDAARKVMRQVRRRQIRQRAAKKARSSV